MNERLISSISAGITAIIGFVFLFYWLLHDPTATFSANIPGLDNQPANLQTLSPEENIQIGQHYSTSGLKPEPMPGDWPQFRGKNLDNISTETIRLADSWDETGPEKLWSIALGEGHASPAVHNGKVYILDYDEEKKADVLRCLSLANGKEFWRRWYQVRIKRNHGISRTVPAVTDEYVITIGPRCHVMAVKAENGDFLWGLDLEKDYNTKTPFWYTGQCPIIENSVAIIAPAGRIMMMGVDCATGKILWETPNPKDWQMSHVSVMPMNLNGKKMYIYSAIGGMVGISAQEEDRGKILWETSLWDHSVLAPSPLVLDDGKIFLTAGYGAGSMVLKVSENNGQYSVEKLQEFKPKEGLASEQQTPLFYEGFLLGIQPKDAGALRNQFVCYHPDDCTKAVWSSGKINRFGLGPYLIADNKIFILNDDGMLTLAKASTTEFVQIAQAKVLDGHDAWGPLAIAGGRLLLRDSKQMVCVDVRAK